MSPERIGRSDDEKLYQPRIHSQWIRALYRIKTETGDPITVLVDRALGEFVARYEGAVEQVAPATPRAESADPDPERRESVYS